MKTLERPVAIQGQAGSYSHEAARRMLGRDARILPCDSFGDVFAAVAENRASRAVVPVENTILGPIRTTRSLLAGGRFRRLEEMKLAVDHCLVVRRDADPGDIRRVASHPAALAQCGRYLRRNPGWRTLATDDTAGAVRALAEDRLAADAAIASAEAARLHGCRVLERGIQDEARNLTRFIVLAAKTAVSRAVVAPDPGPARTGRGPCSPGDRPR